MKEIEELLTKLLDQVSDRNSCLTNLAKARLEIVESMGRLSINDSNDNNGNRFKLSELKDQAKQIDELILKIVKSK